MHKQGRSQMPNVKGSWTSSVSVLCQNAGDQDDWVVARVARAGSHVSLKTLTNA